MRIERILSPVRSLTKRRGDYHVSKSYITGWVIVIVHHMCVVVAGIVGFMGNPSPAVVQIVGGPLASYLWSGAFVFFGAFAFLARIFRRARAEVVAVLSIAAARVLWSCIIFYTVNLGTQPPGSLQVAWLMLSGAIFLVGWSVTVLVWLSGAPVTGPKSSVALVELRDHLREAVDRRAEGDDGE